MTAVATGDGTAKGPGRPDAAVEKLAELFLGHPAWVHAARRLDVRATSNVYFSQRPGEVWQLLNEGGGTQLRPGRAPSPDFALRFTPAAVDRLAAVRGGIGSFAVELFGLIVETDEELRIGFRIIAPFATLARKGYVRLLLAGGSKLLAFGAARGVRTLADLGTLIARIRAREPQGWELEAADEAQRR
jgi:hypothetical protein